jgi:hypothetical protein
MNDLVRRLFVLAIFVIIAANGIAQEIPSLLWGKWVVKRDLPATTISCWDESDVKRFIGTEIEYTATTFRWKDTITEHPAVHIEVVSAEQFREENSSPSASGSQINFRQLGITASQATQITLDHEPAEITGATIEIPGDRVLIKSRNTIVFSVCNVYFEAYRRRPAQTRPK